MSVDRRAARPAGVDAGVRTPGGDSAPPGVGGRRRGPAGAAPRCRQGRAARCLLPRGGRRAGRDVARLGGDAGGVLRGGWVLRAGRGAVHRRDRAAAHGGPRHSRADRRVRPADAGRGEDRRARGHRAGWRVGRRGDHHDRDPRRRQLRRQRRQDVHHQRGPRRLRHHRRAHRAGRDTQVSACSSSRRARPASPSTVAWRRWAGTAPTPPSCPSSTCGCPRPTSSARRTPAST